jgi:hypothetical protein
MDGYDTHGHDILRASYLGYTRNIPRIFKVWGFQISLSSETVNPRPGFLGNPNLKGNIDIFRAATQQLLSQLYIVYNLLACKAESEQDENRTSDSRVSARIWQESGGIWPNKLQNKSAHQDSNP